MFVSELGFYIKENMKQSLNVIDDLMKLLSGYDVISFDIFDTLITRCLPKPNDVFQLVELILTDEGKSEVGFAEAREQAEKNANFIRGYPSFDEIYDELKNLCNLSEEEIKKIKQTEFRIELELLVARRDVLSLFSALIKQGKRIVLVSDMYFSSKQLRKILINCGYELEGVEIVVSNEARKSKQDGTLWAELAKRNEISRWFHIGDNLIGVVRYPKIHGFHVLEQNLRINSPLEQFYENPLSTVLGKYLEGNISEKLILGKIIAFSVFNKAFSSERNETIGAWLGPILGSFMDFLQEESHKLSNPFLLFVTREGYIFKPLFEKYCEILGKIEPPGALFYASRVSTSLAGLNSIIDIEILADTPFNGTVIEFIKSKLGLVFPSVENSKIYSLPSDKASFLKGISPYLKAIFEEAKNQRVLYLEYCQQNLSDSYPVLVDIGFTGRTQYNLSRILLRPVGGLYIMVENRNLPGSIGCPVKSLLHLPNFIYENLPFFEASLQVREQSVLRLEKKNGSIRPLLTNRVLVSPLVQQNFSSVLDFVCFQAKWKKELHDEFKLNPNFIQDVWMGILTSNLLPLEYLNALVLEDEFSGLGLIDVSKRRVNSQRFSLLFLKSKIKNIIKAYIPLFAYNFAREIWIKHIK